MRKASLRVILHLLLIIVLVFLILHAQWKHTCYPYLPASDDDVPNIVHFIRFGKFNMTFLEAVCILAALKNQKPLTLFIHTDQTKYDAVWGKYWHVVKRHPTAVDVIEVKHLKRPKSIFGQKFNPRHELYHASDVERLRTLIKYGGIYLDNDSYLVKSLDVFFRYEMTLGWEPGGGISDQILVAKPNARFLQLWLDSYKDYKGDEWFYNGGELPTILLKKNRKLVNAVRYKFAAYQKVPSLIYYEDSDEWKSHFGIHLLANHQYILVRNVSSEATYPVNFSEVNILKYPVVLRQMALDVYPFDEKIKAEYASLYPCLATEKPPIYHHARKKRIIQNKSLLISRLHPRHDLS